MGKPMSLAATMPGANDNGLLRLIGELCKNPEEGRLVVAIVDVSSVKHVIDDDELVPTIRVQAIEPILDETAAARVRDAMDAAAARRTGRAQLPLQFVPGGGA